MSTRVAKYLTAVMMMMLAVSSTTVLGMQQTAPAKLTTVIPLKVDIVLSRYLADKKISSLPFSLLVNTGNATSLRMGVDVPAGTITTKDRTDGTERTTSDYRNVGTQIDLQATAANLNEEGRYSVSVSVSDSSIVTSDATARATGRSTDPMAFRNFNSRNTLVFRDGQTLQFTMATDKITGEVIKVDVTLSVVK
jgi:hypothetical protein